MPNEKGHPKISSLVKKVTHHHTFFCRKEKGVTCRFSAPWPLSERSLIVPRGKYIYKNLLIGSKKLLGHVLHQITQIDNLQDVTK